MNQTSPILIKLGGSLITDKQQPMTPRLDQLQNISSELADAYRTMPGINLVIGHGSGSYGHAVASQHKTQLGGTDQSYWRGFIEVWTAAHALDQIVLQHLNAAGLPVIAFPPSAGVIASHGDIIQWDLSPMEFALSHGLIPVVQGDVIFDVKLGGTILSTESIFQYLAKHWHPERILLAGSDRGVYQDSNQPDQIIPHITPSNIGQILPAISGSNSADVTGGMLSKVQMMLELVQNIPSVEVFIFSGAESGNIKKAIAGECPGTLITADNH